MRLTLAPRTKRLIVGVILSLLAAWACLVSNKVPAVVALDRIVTDAWLNIRPVTKDPRIVIVDIDERSLAQHGRWPWSRSSVARLTNNLLENGQAKLVAFDVLFAEAEQNSDLLLLDRLMSLPTFRDKTQELAQIRSVRDADQLLMSAFDNKPVVLGYYFTGDRDGHKSGQLPAPLMQTQALADRGWRLLAWTGYGANLKRFMQTVEAGFYTPRIDSDGLVRELPLLGDFEGQTYESLVSVVLRKYLGSPIAEFTNDGLVYRSGKKTVLIPLTPEMTALIPYAGRGGPNGGRYEYVSAIDVLNEKLPQGHFKDKVVLVGTTALGLTDLRATPVNPSFPGVETHASLISGALDADLKTRPSHGPWLMALVALCMGIGLSFVFSRQGVIGIVITGCFAMIGTLTLHAAAAGMFGWILTIGAVLMLVMALSLLHLVVGYFIEGRSRRAVVEKFGQYVAPTLVSRMAQDPQNYKMDSENKELTILFADIRGFTPIAESLSPSDLREFLNRFLDAMSEIIHVHRGTVDKYIGDAVMAFWGAPIDDPDHAVHAVKAAQSMLVEIGRLNDEFSKRGWPKLQIGIGINSGIVRVGDMGSTQRRAYTVIGDAVNMAARFETLTKELKLPLAVGERTQELAGQERFTCLGLQKIAGKNELVKVYCLTELITPPIVIEPTRTILEAQPQPKAERAL